MLSTHDKKGPGFEYAKAFCGMLVSKLNLYVVLVSRNKNSVEHKLVFNKRVDTYLCLYMYLCLILP